MPDLVTVGHVLMDVRMLVDEFPKIDEEAQTKELSLGGGGSAANVAVGASRLGVKSGFIGALGSDSVGRVLLAELEREGVDITHVKIDRTTNSGLTFIAVNSKGQVMMFGFVGASDKLFPSDLQEDYIVQAEHIHITGLNFPTALAAAKIAHKTKVDVSFDPGRLTSKLGLKKLSTLLMYVNQIILNHAEAEEITGDSDIENSAKMFLKAGPKVVIIKRGKEGVFAATRDRRFSVPAYPVKVVDTTGAGDVFSAGFITGHLEGKSLEDAVQFANATANLKITQVGARALPTRKAVEQFLRSMTLKGGKATRAKTKL